MARSIQCWITISVLVLSPLFFGSVDLFWIAVWAVLLSISASCGVVVVLGVRQQRLLLSFLAICFLYGLVALIQIAPNAIGIFSDPIWRSADHILDLDVVPRISSRGEIPPVAAGHFLLFAMSFVSGFYLGTSRKNVDHLIRFASCSILLYAIYGIAAAGFTPDMLLWTEKIAYRGSLTATFVNHNTAATFIGTGMILWFCEAFSTIQLVKFKALRVFLMSRSNEILAFRIIAQSAATLVCLFALLKTGSRGGLICAAMGSLVSVMLMIANKWKLQLRYLLVVAAFAFGLIVVVISRMGRIASQGLIDEARLSVYTLSWQAIRERPLFGAGLGTFPDLFPALRSNALWTWGVWDYAHSTILEIAFEMGVPLAFFVVIGAISSVFILARSAVKAASDKKAILSSATGIAVLGYLHSTIDFSLQIPGYSTVFAILLGCGLSRALAARPVRTSIQVTEKKQPAFVQDGFSVARPAPRD
jgi:O-antigen ligase